MNLLGDMMNKLKDYNYEDEVLNEDLDEILNAV